MNARVRRIGLVSIFQLVQSSPTRRVVRSPTIFTMATSRRRHEGDSVSSCKQEILTALLEDLAFWEPGSRSDNVIENNTQIHDIKTQKQGTSNNVSLQRRPSRQESIETNADSSPPPQNNWKTAVDPVSGKTYYYDVVTRSTQWEKVSPR